MSDTAPEFRPTVRDTQHGQITSEWEPTDPFERQIVTLMPPPRTYPDIWILGFQQSLSIGAVGVTREFFERCIELIDRHEWERSHD